MGEMIGFHDMSEDGEGYMIREILAPHDIPLEVPNGDLELGVEYDVAAPANQ